MNRTTMTRAFVTVTGCALLPALLGQAPARPDSNSAARMQFEAASIRPAAPMNLPGRGGGAISERAGIPGTCIQRLALDQGRLNVRCYSLGKLIWAWAFGISPNRLVGPAWMGDSESDWSGGPKFDIVAKLPEGALRDQVPAMLQDLLATRFKLATHRELREQPVYALVAAKNGLTVQPASPGDADALNATANSSASEPMNMNGVPFAGTRIPSPDGGGSQVLIMNSPAIGTVRYTDSGAPAHTQRFEAPNITFEGVADLLTFAGIGPEPVVNATGNKDRHQIVLEISMAEVEALLRAGSPEQTDLQSAHLKAARDGLKKLGLQLEPRKAPVEMLLIDHLEKAPTDN